MCVWWPLWSSISISVLHLTSPSVYIAGLLSSILNHVRSAESRASVARRWSRWIWPAEHAVWRWRPCLPSAPHPPHTHTHTPVNIFLCLVTVTNNSWWRPPRRHVRPLQGWCVGPRVRRRHALQNSVNSGVFYFWCENPTQQHRHKHRYQRHANGQHLHACPFSVCVKKMQCMAGLWITEAEPQPCSAACQIWDLAMGVEDRVCAFVRLCAFTLITIVDVVADQIQTRWTPSTKRSGWIMTPVSFPLSDQKFSRPLWYGSFTTVKPSLSLLAT